MSQKPFYNKPFYPNNPNAPFRPNPKPNQPFIQKPNYYSQQQQRQAYQQQNPSQQPFKAHPTLGNKNPQYGNKSNNNFNKSTSPYKQQQLSTSPHRSQQQSTNNAPFKSQQPYTNTNINNNTNTNNSSQKNQQNSTQNTNNVNKLSPQNINYKLNINQQNTSNVNNNINKSPILQKSSPISTNNLQEKNQQNELISLSNKKSPIPTQQQSQSQSQKFQEPKEQTQTKENKPQERQKTFFIYPYQADVINSLMPIGFCLRDSNSLKEGTIKPSPISKELQLLKQNNQLSNFSIDQTELMPSPSLIKGNSSVILRANKPKVSIESKYCEDNRFQKKQKTEKLELCINLMVKLKKFKYAEILKISDELNLNIIEQKLKKFQYDSHTELIKDIQQLFDKANQFTESAEMLLKIQEFYKYYKKSLKPIECNDLEQELQKHQKKLDKITRDIKEYQLNYQSLYWKDGKKTKPLSTERMSEQDKLKLKSKIQALPKQYLRGVWEILVDKSIYDKQDFEYKTFNLETINTTKKLRDLEKYVDTKMLHIDKSRSRRKQKKDRKEKERLIELQYEEYLKKNEGNENVNKEQKLKDRKRKRPPPGYKEPLVDFPLSENTDSSMVTDIEESQED